MSGVDVSSLPNMIDSLHYADGRSSTVWILEQLVPAYALRPRDLMTVCGGVTP